MADPNASLRERLIAGVTQWLMAQGFAAVMLTALVAGMWVGIPKYIDRIESRLDRMATQHKEARTEDNIRHLEQIKAIVTSHNESMQAVSSSFDKALLWQQKINEQLLRERGINLPPNGMMMQLPEVLMEPLISAAFARRKEGGE